MNIKALAAALVPALFATACQTAKEAPNLATLGLDFSWSGIPACSSNPPAFRVTNVPAATRTLRFRMTDMNLPSYPHGGGDVAWRGSPDIPAAAFSYTGPCPPAGSRHDYRWDVTALDATAETILGKGSATRPFPVR